MGKIQQEKVVNKEKIYMPAFVFAIIAYIFSFLMPIITYVCAIISLFLVRIKGKGLDTRATKIIAMASFIVIIINQIIIILFAANVDKVLLLLRSFMSK